MRQWFREVFLANWPRKLVALLAAIVVYALVNNSITTTRTIANVPVRIVDLPPDKTVEGLLPSGILSQRVTLTLTGSKRILEELEPGDLEVLIDASNKGEQWIAQIGRKNLIGLNREIDLLPNITRIQHSELILQLARLITVKIPVTIAAPYGEPPNGYQFLDIWPRRLYHTISGPEGQVEELQMTGLQLQFDLGKITRQELDELQVEGPEWLEDEVSFSIPARWKRVAIPFHANALEEVNDPDASDLQIDFLRQELLPLRQKLPIRVFFPPRYRASLNANTHHLKSNDLVSERSGGAVLNLELSARSTSREFLDAVRDQLELTIIAVPEDISKTLRWTIQVVDVNALEAHYVRQLMARVAQEDNEDRSDSDRANALRQRFRDYLREMEIVTMDDQRLNLRATLDGSEILLERD